MKRCFLILIAITQLASLGLGQENNNWCFDFHVGLNFNTSPPNRFTDSIYPEARSYTTVSDCAGNLLFTQMACMFGTKNIKLCLMVFWILLLYTIVHIIE